MGHVTETLLTPQAAADHLEIGRTTVMNAIKDRRLLAHRDNSGRWKITLEDLETWWKSRPKPVKKTAPVTVNATGTDSALVSAEIRAGIAEAKVELLEKTHAAEMIRLEGIIEALTAKLAAPEHPKPTFLQRLMGASGRS